jgi:hypothetical protein
MKANCELHPLGRNSCPACKKNRFLFEGPLSVTDFHAVVESITARDLQLTLETLGLDEANLYTAIGKTIPPAGRKPLSDEELVRPAPVIGMRRGGALTG